MQGLVGPPQTPKPVDDYSYLDTAPAAPEDEASQTGHDATDLDPAAAAVPTTVSLENDPHPVTHSTQVDPAVAQHNALPSLDSIVPKEMPLLVPTFPAALQVPPTWGLPPMGARPVGGRGLPPGASALPGPLLTPAQKAFEENLENLNALNPWKGLTRDASAVISKGLDMLEQARHLNLSIPARLGLQQLLKEKLTAVMFSKDLQSWQLMECKLAEVRRFNTASLALQKEHKNPLLFTPISEDQLAAASAINMIVMKEAALSKRLAAQTRQPPNSKRQAIEPPLKAADVIVLKKETPATAQPDPTATASEQARQLNPLTNALHTALAENAGVEEALHKLNTFMVRNAIAYASLKDGDRTLVMRAQAWLGMNKSQTGST
jgi:hypothetical protein